MNHSRIAGLLALALVSLYTCGRSDAGFIPLPSDMGTLTTNGNYTGVGSQTYTFTNYNSSSTIPGDSILASSLHVSAVTTPSTGFELTGSIAAPGISQNDISFDYTVASASQPITSVTLNGNGAVTGGGIASITETVYTNSSRTTLLGELVVTTGTETLNLKEGYASVYITEDILFNTYGNGDSASFSIIDQTFSVPEPSSLAMLILGLAGLGAAARFRRRRLLLA